MVVRSPRTGEGVAVDEEVERAGRIKRKKNQSDKHFKDDNSASPIYSLLRDATRRSSAMRFDSTEFYDRTGREGDMKCTPSIGARRRLLDRVSRVYVMTNRP